MKKAILILLVTLAALPAAFAQAETTSYTVVLAGGASQNLIHIWLSPDGRSYVIDSAVPLEVGGSVCENASAGVNELTCKAPMVAGFLVNGGSGDDSLSVAPSVSVPLTLRGGGGSDLLIGGSGPDKLTGGDGGDRIWGGAGDDLIFGGPGEDSLFGGPGSDILRGGLGSDTFGGGSGNNSIYQDYRRP